MIGFYPTNQKTLYWLLLFYYNDEIITVCGKPTIFTLIGWFKSSHLFSSLSGFFGPYITKPKRFTLQTDYNFLKLLLGGSLALSSPY